MGWRQCLILWSVYALFLALGAALFSKYLECEVHRWPEIQEPNEWKQLKGVALGEERRPTDDEVLELSRFLPRVCPNIANATINALTQPGTQTAAVLEAEVQCPQLHQEIQQVEWVCQWSFIDGLFFCMTVTTTIGYGWHYPITIWGRVVCMLYAMVGIPLTVVLLASSSGFFGDQLFKLFKATLDSKKQQDKRFIALFTIMYIMAGFVVFIFIPAAVFTALEDWTYVTSVWYCFTTLTTIGFGDLVPIGQDWNDELRTGAVFATYQIGVILWIMLGLGYWVVVANFATKAIKSKRLQFSAN